MKYKDTRELAEALRNTAAYLDSIESFKTDGIFCIVSDASSLHYYDKNLFVAGVKAMGDATKTYDAGEFANLNVTAKAFPFTLKISRDKVCRKVVKFECDPLFSAEELETL